MTQFVWLDLETTGLSPENNVILEIAVGLSTAERPFDVEIVLDRALHFDFDNAHWQSIRPEVVEMHARNGLWNACKTSDTLRCDLDGILLEKAIAADIQDGAHLAGSSVYFDREFLRRAAPRFCAKLHHRLFCVSAIKMFCELLGMPRFPKGEAHRAKDDILESAEHASLCMQWLREHGFRSPDDAVWPLLGSIP